MDISSLKSMKLQLSIDCLPGSICYGNRTNALHLTLLNTNHSHSLNASQTELLTEWLSGKGYACQANHDEVTLKLYTKESALELIQLLERAGILDTWSNVEIRGSRPARPNNDFSLLHKQVTKAFDDFFTKQSLSRGASRGTAG